MKMRKLGLGIIGASLLVLTGFESPSAAGVNVNIMVPPPVSNHCSASRRRDTGDICL